MPLKQKLILILLWRVVRDFFAVRLRERGVFWIFIAILLLIIILIASVVGLTSAMGHHNPLAVPRAHASAPLHSTHGRSSVTAPTTPNPGRSPAGGTSHPRTVTVRPGDSLWSLARHYLGNGLGWHKLWHLNHNKISNPNRIYPGQVLLL